MQTITLGSSGLESSRLVYGCMRIAGSGSQDDLDKGRRALHAAVDAGYTQFDHADIYGSGLCETLFGEFLRDNPGVRERIIVTTKCGIRMAGDPDEHAPGRYDFSARHITTSVEGSLRRLGIERIDLLLLHRPDYLFRAHEVAVTLEALKASGAVANFGVSNFSPSQVDLLRSAVGDALLVNQVEINLHNISALTDGTLDQCQRLGMTPQAWCPLASVAYPAWGNTFTEHDERRIRAELERQGEKYEAEDWIVALAWLLKHPAGISPVIGSTTPGRIEAAKQALDLEYERVDWYRLFEARNGAPVP
jgi:predicted oxidoreductase